MARITWEQTGSVLAQEIIAGKHDEDLQWIQQACAARLKTRLRKGTKVRVKGASDASLNDKEATILKVNTKTVTIGVGTRVVQHAGEAWEYTEYDGGEWNVSPNLLEVI